MWEQLEAIRKKLVALFAQTKTLEPKRSTKHMNLIEAVIEVESGGDDNAIGDRGLIDHAYGCLQIRQPAVTDVNRKNGTRWHASDCLGKRELSTWIFNEYMALYATEKQLGRAVTDEDRARIWNGGPAGYRKRSTVGYWEKVRKNMQG